MTEKSNQQDNGKSMEELLKELQRQQHFRDISSDILKILNECSDFQDAIQRVLLTLKTGLDADAAGMRLKEGDDFPYFVQDGFSADFLLAENTLLQRNADGGVCRDEDGNISLECTCGLVLAGQTDPSNPLFTDGGSCWTNNSFPLLDIPADEDPRLNPRNNCIHQGYASVALIPVRDKKNIIGLLQLNSKKPDIFTITMIQELEKLGSQIGEALMRKQTEEILRKSEEKYRFLFENMGHGVVYQERSGQIISANASALKILGLTWDQITGRTSTDPLWKAIREDGSDYPGDQHPAMVAIQTGKPSYNNLMGVFDPLEERYKWIHIDAFPQFREGESSPYQVFTTFNDITEIREAHEAAEKANRTKSSFLANMSHEIRTPLNGVIGYARLLEECASTDEQREYAKHTITCARTLMTIVDEILDFSKIEAEKLQLDEIPVKLEDEIQQAASVVRLAAIDKGLDFKVEMPDALPGPIALDPVRLRQVLVNLLSNAVKFTHQGTITFRLECTEDPDASDGVSHRYRFSVIDTGIGIQPEHQAKLFDAFFQADASIARKYGGTGLGLPISNALVSLMGGQLELESRADEGSVFHFTLTRPAISDVSVPEHTTKDESAIPATTTSGRTILIVDDAPLNLKLLSTQINKMMPEAVVIKANDGCEALEQYRKHRPDLVLLDIQMPRMDGYEATRHIREMEQTNHYSKARIIALTAGMVKGEEHKASEAGMDGYILKPADPSVLKEIIFTA